MVVVGLRVHRRATSVPVGEPSIVDEPNIATHNSLLLSKAVIDNTDALSSASKRNDQQFLRDIGARIGSAPFSQPYVKKIKKTHVHGSGVPLETRRRSIAVSSILRPPVVYDETDADDVDYQVQLLAPLTNRITRYGRATSVPPQPVSLTSAVYPVHPIVSKHTVVSGHRHPERVYVSGDDAEFYHTPSIYDLEAYETVPSSTYYQKLNPVADLAVRQAHQHLGRIESELKSSGDVIIPRAVLRTTTYRDVGPRLRSSSYHGPRSSVVVRTRSPSPVGRVTTTPITPARRLVRSSVTRTTTPTFYSDEDLIDYLPPTSKKLERDSVIKAKLLLAAATASADADLYPVHYIHHAKTDLPSSLALTSVKRTTNGPGKILHDLHIHTPDTYVAPISVSKKVSTVLPSVIHSVTPLVPTLHTSTIPHIITTPSTLTTITQTIEKPPTVPKLVLPIPLPPSPPTPSKQLFPPGLPTVIRPKVSDTRRKVRDVLCKVKGDPHYFDY